MKEFRLKAIYEFDLRGAGDGECLRVEVLASEQETAVFRVRVWISNAYNLYPTRLNTADDGGPVRRIHSADELRTEITRLLSRGEEFISGFPAASPEEAARYAAEEARRLLSTRTRTGDSGG